MPSFHTIYVFSDNEALAADITAILTSRYPTIRIVAPVMPFGPGVPVSAVLAWARTTFRPLVEKNSLIIGFGLGGLVACALQEQEPDLNVSVFAVNAPVWDGTDGPGAVELAWDCGGPEAATMRIALYSSAYEPLANWQAWADEAYDVPWLQHGADLAKHAIVYMIAAFLRDGSIKQEIATLFPDPKTEDSAH
jgi:pimeloyl-ACP methyl ester carboxylesterase